MNSMDTAPKDGRIITIHRRDKETGERSTHRAKWILDPTSFFRPSTPGWQTLDGKWIEVPFIDLIGWG